MSASTTIRKAPWDIERKKYLCAVTRESPVSVIDFKVTMRGVEPIHRMEPGVDGVKRAITRPRYYAVQFCERMTQFADEKDMDGYPVPGRINELSVEEIKDLETEINRRVVRWRGRANNGRGVGPNKIYTDGQVLCTHDFEGSPTTNYNPKRGDKPLWDYINLRPIVSDEFARSKTKSEKAGWKTDADQEPISVKELEAKLASTKKQLEAARKREETQAEESEQESVSKPGGVFQKRKQTRKKRGG